jgi:(p)ppGpp synthase/HD superfamily hydrolase
MINLPMNDIALILRATAFAADKHRDQRRRDAKATPYINHPIALANAQLEGSRAAHGQQADDVARSCARLNRPRQTVATR